MATGTPLGMLETVGEFEWIRYETWIVIRELRDVFNKFSREEIFLEMEAHIGEVVQHALMQAKLHQLANMTDKLSQYLSHTELNETEENLYREHYECSEEASATKTTDENVCKIIQYPPNQKLPPSIQSKKRKTANSEDTAYSTKHKPSHLTSLNKPVSQSHHPPSSRTGASTDFTNVRRSSERSYMQVQKPTRGLNNLGNTCYMNCILQCLSHTLPLREFFVSDKYKKCLQKSSSGDISYAFKCVMTELWNSREFSHSPYILKRKVGEITSRFSEYGKQQDAHEFMRFLLTGIHEEINNAKVKVCPYPVDGETPRDACKRYKATDDSKISELFSGMLRNEVCCSVCKYESVVFNSFMDLPLPIKKPDSEFSLAQSYASYSHGCNTRSHTAITVEDCLQALTQKEILDDEDCRPYCNTCKGVTKSAKQLSIAKLPKLLVIQLKRFSVHTVRRKLFTPVLFDEEWEIEDMSKQKQAYSLYGIVCHSGSIYGGHYTAYCKYNKEWRLFDDSYAASENWEHIKRQQAYLLFYERINSK